MEYLCKLFISWLRYTDTYIFGGKTGQQTTERNKFHFAVIDVDNYTAAETVIPMHKGVEKCFTNGFFGVILLICTHNSLNNGRSFIAQSKIIYCVLKLIENGATKLLTISELRTKFIFEYSNLCSMKALVGKKHSEICKNIVLRDAQCPILFNGKLHTVPLKSGSCSIKGQFLFKATGIFVIVTVRLFYHSANLFGRCLYAGCALTDVNPCRLHSSGFQIIRLVAAFSNFNTDHLVILQNVFNEHSNIRLDCITDAVCNSRVGFIHIVKTYSVAIVINTDIENAPVCVCKSNDFFVNIIHHLQLKFDILRFKNHRIHLS